MATSGAQHRLEIRDRDAPSAPVDEHRACRTPPVFAVLADPRKRPCTTRLLFGVGSSVAWTAGSLSRSRGWKAAPARIYLPRPLHGREGGRGRFRRGRSCRLPIRPAPCAIMTKARSAISASRSTTLSAFQNRSTFERNKRRSLARTCSATTRAPMKSSLFTPKTDLCCWRLISSASFGASVPGSEGRATIANYEFGGYSAAHRASGPSRPNHLSRAASRCGAGS